MRDLHGCSVQAVDPEDAWLQLEWGEVLAGAPGASQNQTSLDQMKQDTCSGRFWGLSKACRAPTEVVAYLGCLGCRWMVGCRVGVTHKMQI